MQLPDYWLPRPSATSDEQTASLFDGLLASTLSRSGCPAVEFDLPLSKWQFLCYVADRHNIALHGSGDPNIELFEPRQSNDLGDFGNQKAVYAASDGIWPMFFAIVDRTRYTMSVANACVRLVDQQGKVDSPYYVFSISQQRLAQQPWRTGTVYLLPRQSFVVQPPVSLGDYEIQIPQLASLEPVPPLAKLTVTPEDFPLLSAIRGHDDERLQEYATAMQTGAPWPDDKLQ